MEKIIENGDVLESGDILFFCDFCMEEYYPPEGMCECPMCGFEGLEVG